MSTAFISVGKIKNDIGMVGSIGTIGSIGTVGSMLLDYVLSFNLNRKKNDIATWWHRQKSLEIIRIILISPENNE